MANRKGTNEAKPEGMKHKFLVLKHDDIDKALEHAPYIGNYLDELSHEISGLREDEGRDPNPTYIVINTDEPYADEVIDILKRNGHWG